MNLAGRSPSTLSLRSAHLFPRRLTKCLCLSIACLVRGPAITCPSPTKSACGDAHLRRAVVMSRERPVHRMGQGGVIKIIKNALLPRQCAEPCADQKVLTALLAL